MYERKAKMIKIDYRKIALRKNKKNSVIHDMIFLIIAPFFAPFFLLFSFDCHRLCACNLPQNRGIFLHEAARAPRRPLRKTIHAWPYVNSKPRLLS